MNFPDKYSYIHRPTPFRKGLRSRAVSLLAWIALAATMVSCSQQRQRSGGNTAREPEKRADVQDYTQDAMRSIDSLMSGMDRREKVGQLFMPAVYAVADEATMRRVKGYAEDLHVGGIVLLRGDCGGAKAIADTLAAICRKTGIWIAIDAETGLAMRLTDAPAIPVAAELGLQADGQRMYDYGCQLARDCRRLGINMVLGPVLDVETKSNGYIGRRSFGSDPDKVAELGVSFARGLEDGQVASVAKHFPGHGGVDADTHKRMGVIHLPLSQIEQTALVPFREYCEAGLSGVMAGHLAVPAIDPQQRPASLSPPVITDLLREDLGFDGLVLTDALNMKGASGASGYADSSVAAIAAGADIVIAPANTEKAISSVEKAIEEGVLTDSVLDSRVRRILFFKYRFALRPA